MGGLAIVIVTYNSEDSIGHLLESIGSASPGESPRVLVVDNGSTDETIERVAEYPWVEVVQSANFGYAAGINRGIERSPDAEAHLILNPDLELTPGAVTGLMDELRTPGVGIVAPKILGPRGQLEHSMRREPTLLRAVGLGFTGLPLFSEYVQEEAAYERPTNVDWVLGAALLVSRECSLEVGEWDESFFLYSEETDYCARARAAGWTVRFTPTATAIHLGGGSGRNDRTHVMQIVNRVRYYARSRPWPAGAAYWTATVLSELTWIARGHAQSRASVQALLAPRRRPREIGCNTGIIPR